MKRSIRTKWVSLALSALMLISPFSSLANMNSSLTEVVEQSLSSEFVAVKPPCHNQNPKSSSKRKVVSSADSIQLNNYGDKQQGGGCSGLCLCSIGGCSATTVPSFDYSFSFNAQFVRYLSVSTFYSSPSLDLSNPPPIS